MINNFTIIHFKPSIIELLVVVQLLHRSNHHQMSFMVLGGALRAARAATLGLGQGLSGPVRPSTT